MSNENTEQKCLRSPIVSVLGHVDHGKSSVLDAIRDSNILATEAGAITQAIGASLIPLKTIKEKCGDLLAKMSLKITIPGLLFIDTPGHAAFTSLRKRGGSLADIAIVVIDINEGFKPQTIEAIEILRASKTPFIIVANKLDLISRFDLSSKIKTSLGIISAQDKEVQQAIENKIYEIVGELHEKFQIPSERFDRVSNFTKEIAIVPVSAQKKIGISEVLMVISALAQKYLEENLKLNVNGFAKGSILEVKEEKGIGKTMDVIIYEGTLKVGDTIVIGRLGEPLVTRVKALFEPAPLTEMRDKKSKFTSMKQVVAATGVKISCPDMTDVISGMSVISCLPKDTKLISDKLKEEIEDVIFDSDKEGIIIKADTIGGIEAMIVLLKEKGIPIRKALIGEVTKKDISDAESSYESNPLNCIILCFNLPETKSTDKVKIISSPVIYHVIDEFEEWQEKEKERIESKKLKDLPKPCKIEVLKNCIFRQSNPCIMGIEVLSGELTTDTVLMKNNGNKLSQVKSIQADKDSVQSVLKGRQVAISLPNVTAGRQVFEDDILYSNLNEEEFRSLKKLSRYLLPDQIDLLKEIAEIKRKENPLWGI